MARRLRAGAREGELEQIEGAAPVDRRLRCEQRGVNREVCTERCAQRYHTSTPYRLSQNLIEKGFNEEAVETLGEV